MEMKELAKLISDNVEETKKSMVDFAAKTTKTDGDIAEIKETLKGLQSNTDTVLAENKTAIEAEVQSRRELEAKMKRTALMGDPDKAMSIGAEFIKSSAYLNYMKDTTVKQSGDFIMEGKTLTSPTPTFQAPLQVTEQVGLILPRQNPIAIRDLIPTVSTTASSVFWFVESGYTNRAKVVRESGLKPESDFVFTPHTAEVATIAHTAEITNQQLADNPWLQNYIDGRMRYGLILVEDYEILYGVGGADSLLGIKNTPNVQTLNWSDGDLGDNRIDVILDAIVMAMVAYYIPDGTIMNIKDAAKIRKMRALAGTGDYLYSDVTKALTGGTLWGTNFVPTTVISEGEFLTGNFNLGLQIRQREQVNMRIGEPDDNFRRNKKTMLVEERLALTCIRPDALVWGTLDNTPTS